ncbi:MAG: MBL fold metallo-hydrolase [Archaeoglobaceae archaeon]
MDSKLEEISEGIFAYIQHRGEWFVNNTGLIAGRDFSIVIDTVANEKRARTMIEKFNEVLRAPVKLLVNTHGHGDHVWTNYMFKAVSICHENCRKDTIMANPEIIKNFFPEFDFSGAKTTPQNLTFSREAKIYVDNLEIHLIHPGIAHTSGDIYVYIPEKKTIFCGDLLFSKPCTPFVLMGSVLGNIRALEELLRLDADIYVPGHGEVATKKEVEEALEYLRFVYSEAKLRFEKGMTLREIIDDVELGKFKKWNESERIVANLARAYAELSNSEIDIFEVVRLMRGRR